MATSLHYAWYFNNIEGLPLYFNRDTCYVLGSLEVSGIEAIADTPDEAITNVRKLAYKKAVSKAKNKVGNLYSKVIVQDPMPNVEPIKPKIAIKPKIERVDKLSANWFAKASLNFNVVGYSDKGYLTKLVFRILGCDTYDFDGCGFVYDIRQIPYFRDDDYKKKEYQLHIEGIGLGKTEEEAIIKAQNDVYKNAVKSLWEKKYSFVLVPKEEIAGLLESIEVKEVGNKKVAKIDRKLYNVYGINSST